jgi:hypothetical protein
MRLNLIEFIIFRFLFRKINVHFLLENKKYFFFVIIFRLELILKKLEIV